MNTVVQQPTFLGNLQHAFFLFAIPLPDPLKELVFEYRYGFRLGSIRDVQKQIDNEDSISIDVTYEMAIRKFGVLAKGFKRPLFINEEILHEAIITGDENLSLDKCQLLAFLWFQDKCFFLSDPEICTQDDWYWQRLTITGDEKLVQQLATKVEKVLKDMDDISCSDWNPDFWMCAMIEGWRMRQLQRGT